MSLIKKVVSPQDLSNQFVIDTVAQKILLNIDGTTLVTNSSGVISSTGGSITPILTVGNEIATILQAGTSISLKESITKIVDALNSVTYTDEAGVDTVSTKIGTVVHTINAVDKTLTTTINGVDSNVLDISAFYVDINVDSIDSTQAANYIWKFKETDGTVHTLDLSSLVAITTSNGLTISFSGNGTTATPLTGELIIDPVTGNLLKVGSAGAKVLESDILALHTATVELQNAFGTTIGFLHTLTSM